MIANIRLGLKFDGQCEAAFRFYANCLDGRIEFMLRWRDSPLAAKAPGDWGDKMLHASLALNDGTIVGADALPGTYEVPRGFGILISLADPAEADRAFAALAVKGLVHMPLQETFWAHRYGMLTDQFGTPWEINCERLEQTG